MTNIRYICRKCGYKWTDQVQGVKVMDLPISTPDCGACREEKD